MKEVSLNILFHTILIVKILCDYVSFFIGFKFSIHILQADLQKTVRCFYSFTIVVQAYFIFSMGHELDIK